MRVRRTTDQLRTTTVELSAHQRSTMDTGDKWFTLDDTGGTIWGQGVAGPDPVSPIVERSVDGAGRVEIGYFTHEEAAAD